MKPSKQPKQGPKPPKKIDYAAADKQLNREALAILRKCKAPAHWGEREAAFLLRMSVGKYFIWSDRTEEAAKRRDAFFMHLYKEATCAVNAALPKLENRYCKRFDSSRFVAFYYGTMDGQFWEGKPNEVLRRLFATGNNIKGQLSMTPKTIEKARQAILDASKKTKEHSKPWWAGLPVKPK